VRTSTSSYRLCYAGQDLYNQIMKAYPRRDTRSDGWVGDASHSARKSDHNVNWSWRPGIVKALDVDKDGFPDFNAFVERIRVLASRGDRRFRGGYIIWNRRIASAKSGWRWTRYTGENGHTAHAHFSFADAKADFDARGTYPVKAAAARPAPVPTPYGRTSKGDRVLGMANPLMQGADVKNVQNFLRSLGNPGLKADGVYGQATGDLVTKFKANPKRNIQERGWGEKCWAQARKEIAAR
jgi:hypothetical protein